MPKSSQKDEQSNEIIKELEKFIDKTGYDWLKSNKKSPSNKSVNILFNERKLVAYLLLVYIILWLFLILLVYLLFYSDVSSWRNYVVLILMMIILFMIGLGFIDSIFLIFKRKKPKEFINKIREVRIDDYWDVIKKLGNNIDLASLKKEKIKIKVILNKIKKSEKRMEKFNYIFALLFILLIVFVFGIPVHSLDKNWIVSILGISGVIAIITATLSLIREVSDGYIIIYEKCLFILQEAEVLANALEEQRFRNIMIENKARVRE
ncbi:MAG: hypothetical protein QNJ34_16240 [Xenococcaceae cyanobacterium MO_188.B29]|nr:hypothetical protein [Xenococcaceae cyanobacterium MO_188.B29]